MEALLVFEEAVEHLVSLEASQASLEMMSPQVHSCGVWQVCNLR